MSDSKDVKPAEPARGSGELTDAALSQVTGGYQSWMTVLKSGADSKGETQKQLARFG